MQIAITTGSLSENTLEALDKAQELGFTAVEVSLQPSEFGYGFDRKPNLAFYQRLAADVQARGLQVVSVHSPPLAGHQVWSGRIRGDILVTAARVGGYLGARCLVVHPDHIFTSAEDLERYFQERTAAPVVIGFDEAWAQLVNRRMALAVENIQHWRTTPGLNQVDRMVTVTTDLAVHSVLNMTPGRPGPNLKQWVDRLGTRIVLLRWPDLLNGREQPPSLLAESAGWAPLLQQTSTQAWVIEPDPAASPAQIVESRMALEELWARSRETATRP